MSVALLPSRPRSAAHVRKLQTPCKRTSCRLCTTSLDAVRTPSPFTLSTLSDAQGRQRLTRHCQPRVQYKVQRESNRRYPCSATRRTQTPAVKAYVQHIALAGRSSCFSIKSCNSSVSKGDAFVLQSPCSRRPVQGNIQKHPYHAQIDHS